MKSTPDGTPATDATARPEATAREDVPTRSEGAAGHDLATRSDVRLTAWTLAAGTAVSAVCFVVGFVLALLGRPEEVLDPLRVEMILGSVVAFSPSGWSMLGVLAVMLTPAVGLLASFMEMRVRQPRAAIVALGVLGVLGVAALIAVATG